MPQLLTPLLEHLCPKPGLHLPIPSTKQMSIGRDHAIDGPIMGLESHHRLLTFLFSFGAQSSRQAEDGNLPIIVASRQKLPTR